MNASAIGFGGVAASLVLVAVAVGLSVRDRLGLERSILWAATRAFVQLVEAEVGVPISVVGVGAERDDYLHWG